MTARVVKMTASFVRGLGMLTPSGWQRYEDVVTERTYSRKRHVLAPACFCLPKYLLVLLLVEVGVPEAVEGFDMLLACETDARCIL